MERKFYQTITVTLQDSLIIIVIDLQLKMFTIQNILRNI